MCNDPSRSDILNLQKEVLLLQKQKFQMEMEKLAMEKDNLNLQSILLNHKLNELAEMGHITITKLSEQ